MPEKAACLFLVFAWACRWPLLNLEGMYWALGDAQSSEMDPYTLLNR